MFSPCLALFHRCCSQCLSCRHAAPSVFVLVLWNTCCKVTPETPTAAQLLMFMLRGENVVQTQPLLTSRRRLAELRRNLGNSEVKQPFALSDMLTIQSLERLPPGRVRILSSI